MVRCLGAFWVALLAFFGRILGLTWVSLGSHLGLTWVSLGSHLAWSLFLFCIFTDLSAFLFYMFLPLPKFRSCIHFCIISGSIWAQFGMLFGVPGNLGNRAPV